MTTKTSPFNKRVWFLFRHVFSRLKGLCLISCIIYFTVFALPFIIRSVEGTNSFYSLESGIYDLSGVLLFIIPVLLPFFAGVMALQFIHQADRADFYYSLPVKRTTLFLTHYLAGLLVVLIPLLMIYFPSAVTVLFTNPYEISLAALGGELLTLFATMWISYTLVCFIGVFTSTLLDHVLYTAGIGGAITLGITYTMIFLSTLLNGFPENYLSIDGGMGALWGNPFLLSYRIFINDDQYRLLFLLLGTILAIGALVVSLIGFCRHGCERAGRVGGRTLVKEICKYVGAYIGGLLLSLALGQLSSLSTGVMMLGVILGSFIVYTIIEAISMRSFRTFGKSMKGYVISLFCFLALFLVVRFDVMGYQDRIPPEDNIASVTISYGGIAQGAIGYDEKPLYTIQSIQAVRKIHESLIENPPPLEDPEALVNDQFLSMQTQIQYQLKSGMTLQRSYSWISKESFESFGSLLLSPEFREQTDIAQGLKPDEKNTFEILDQIGNEKLRLNLTLEEQKLLLEAIAKDRENETVEEYLHPDQPALGYLYISPNTDALSENLSPLLKNYLELETCSVLINSYDRNTIEFLKEKGVIDEFEVKEISAAFVAKVDETKLVNMNPLFYSNTNSEFRMFTDMLQEFEGWQSITGDNSQGKEKIQQLLACAYQRYEYDPSGYVVCFTTDEKQEEVQTFFIPQEKAPEFLVQLWDNNNDISTAIGGADTPTNIKIQSNP